MAVYKIWGCGIFCWHQEAIRESFLHENLFPPNSHTFSPTKVSRYTVCNEKDVRVTVIVRQIQQESTTRQPSDDSSFKECLQEVKQM